MVMRIVMEYDAPCFVLKEGANLDAAHESIRRNLIEGVWPNIAGKTSPTRVEVQSLQGGEGPVVWFCGRWKDGSSWELHGVFGSEANAAAACEAPDYFVCPAVLGLKGCVNAPEGSDWPGFYYPLQRVALTEAARELRADVQKVVG